MAYEKLCENPEQEMNRICQFLGIPFQPACTELVKQGRHNVCGNPMRFDVDKTTIQLDTSWKEALTPSDLETFRRKGGNLTNCILGYRQAR